MEGRFPLNAGRFSPGGAALATAGDGVDFWDVRTGRRIGGIAGAGGDALPKSWEIDCIAFDLEGKRLFTAERGTLDDCDVVRVWGLPSGKLLRHHTVGRMPAGTRRPSR